MGQLSSDRVDVRGRTFLESDLLKPTWSSTSDLIFYRGSAIAIKRSEGQNENAPGLCWPMTGSFTTANYVFAGICARRIVIPKSSSAPEFPKFGIPVWRYGTFRFKYVGSNPGDTVVGAIMYFDSDWEVTNSADSRIKAGRAVKFIGPDMVEVEISKAVLSV